MPPSGYSLRAHTVESLTRVNRPDVPWQVVLRNTAAIVIPLGVGLATGYTQAGLGVAVGALNTMFSDQPGPYRQRMRNLLLASSAAGLASLLGFLIGGQLIPLLVVATVFGFVGALLVVFGADAARVGMTSMILLVVTAATPTSLGDALIGSALIASGGLLLTVFSLAAWPLQRYWPERHALATVYAGLATLARQRTHDAAEVPALTEAMTTLQRTLLGRYRSRGRAMEAFGVLLELAERIRLELTAIMELHADSTVHAMFRDDAARVLQAIANALLQGASPEQASRALKTLHASEQALLDGGEHTDSSLTAHIHELSGQLAAAVRNADWAGSRGELRASAAETRLPPALRSNSNWATLRANLTPRSVAFRHAVRTAACLSGALLLSRLLSLPHGYWMAMTAAIVLRPDFAATFNFGLLRVLGTVLGLVATSILLHLTPDSPWAHLALMTLLCMTFRYLATAHYGVAVAALTGTVVVLLSFEGVASGTAVSDRIVNTVLGSGIALLAYVTWPTWERGRARTALATMFDAYACYLRTLMPPDQQLSRHESRTAARTARTNAQASIDRMRIEPATPPELLTLARALFANGNRLARTSMTLESSLGDLARLPEQAAIQCFVDDVAKALETIATALRDQHSIDDQTLPNLRAQQLALINLMRHAKDRTTANALLQLAERLLDSIQAMSYVMDRSQQEPACPPASSQTPR